MGALLDSTLEVPPSTPSDIDKVTEEKVVVEEEEDKAVEDEAVVVEEEVSKIKKPLG